MSPIDAFLREIECFDLKWFAELGGYAARAEVSALRQMAGRVDKRTDTSADTSSDDSPRPLNLDEVIGNEADRLGVNWMDHTQALLVGPDAVMKLARIREALFDLASGQLTGAACLQAIAQAVLSIEERAALHVTKVIPPRPAPTPLDELYPPEWTKRSDL